jgi:hypothetical protein
VTVPAGGSVPVTPPFGFITTDFAALSEVVGGVDLGGATIFDPPSTTDSVTTIKVPCPARGTQVWTFQYFGATNYGPVFANAPMSMDGFDADGFPRVELAKTDANGNPVLNTSGGHCFPPTGTTVLADPATRTVRPEFAPKTSGGVCLELTFTSTVDIKASPANGGAQK